MRRLSSVWALGMVLGIGCGGGDGGGGGIDEGPSAQPGTVNAAAMASSVGQADTMRTAVASGNGDSIAGGAITLSSSAMTAVTPKSGALTIEQNVAQMLTIVRADSGMTGTKTCDAAGCVFDKYGVGSTTISGTVKAADDAAGAGKHVTWDLTGNGTDSGSSSSISGLTFTYNWKGDLVVSETALAGKAGGTWHGTGSAQGQSFEFDYGSLLKWTAVTLASGCPTAGTAYAKMWLTAHAGGRSQNQAYEGTHTFNGCAK